MRKTGARFEHNKSEQSVLSILPASADKSSKNILYILYIK